MRLLLLILFSSLLWACDLNVGGSQDGDSEDTTIISNDTSESGSGNLGDNPRCPAVGSLDGAGGFLWKPESEKDGNLVILFPKEYVTPFLTVLAFKENGTADSGAFTGFTNDDRQTWRFPLRGSEYTGRVLVDAGDQECEWFVPDPSRVQD